MRDDGGAAGDATGDEGRDAVRDGAWDGMWEQIAPGVARRRLPHLDVGIGLVVGARGVLLVDTGSTLREGRELRAQAEGLTGRPVTHVMLTHGHFDHVFGAAAFPGARIYGDRGLRGYLRREGDALRASAVDHGTDPAEAAAAAAALAEQAGTGHSGHVLHALHAVHGELSLDLGGRTVRLVHPGPGHTDHDLAALVPGAGPSDPAVVFCGDLVEESGEPQSGHDATPAAWPAALDALLALGGERAKYVPGHGAVVDARFVRAQQRALAARAVPEGGGPTTF